MCASHDLRYAPDGCFVKKVWDKLVSRAAITNYKYVLIPEV